MPVQVCGCLVPCPWWLPAQCLGELGTAGAGSSQGLSCILLAKGRILPCPTLGSAGAPSLAMHLSGSVPPGCWGTLLSLGPL